MPFMVPRPCKHYAQGKSAKNEPSGTQKGNGVKEYDDKHAMERHQHGPDPVGKGKVIKTDD